MIRTAPGSVAPARTPTASCLRQYLSKGTDLSVYSQEELDAIGRQHEQWALGHARLQHAAGRLLSHAGYGSAASNFNSITESCASDLEPPFLARQVDEHGEAA